MKTKIQKIDENPQKSIDHQRIRILGRFVFHRKYRWEENSEAIEKDLSKNSVHRICAKNVYSPNNFPAANNTAFDGFAINSKETKKINNNKGKKFKIIKIIAAGDNPRIKKIPNFSSIEVMTGAVIQRPFDTVIPIENIKYYPIFRHTSRIQPPIAWDLSGTC